MIKEEIDAQKAEIAEMEYWNKVSLSQFLLLREPFSCAKIEPINPFNDVFIMQATQRLKMKE